MRLLAVLALALAAAAQANAAPLLQPCSVGGTSARCGTVVVPENRTQPTGKTISLRVAVLPPTGKPVRPDPLFLIAGGPGGVAVDLLPGAATAFAGINQNRALVFVDQRGVGGSNPLSCVGPEASYAGTVADFVGTCLASTKADVTQYRTPQAIDDLESVRIALGYDKVNLYGGSYGATAVQMYVVQHPEHLRAVIMDSGSWLDVPVLERWGSSAQRALDLIHIRCLKDRDCAKAFPRWYQRFRPLLWKLAHGGAVQRDVVGEGLTTINASTTADTIEDMTTAAQWASQVPFVLARAEAGDFEPLAREVAARSGDGSTLRVMPYAIMCKEPWAAHDPVKIWADARKTYMRYSSWTPSWVFVTEMCKSFPAVTLAPEESVRPHSTLPVLDLVGQADPKDPIGNMPGFKQAMPNGLQLVVPEQGHGTATAGCMPRVLAEFLDAGTVRGLDTSCVSLIQAPAFRLR